MSKDRYSRGVKSVIGSATGCNPVPSGSVGSIPTRPTKRHHQPTLSQFRCGVGVMVARQLVTLMAWVRFPYVTPKLIFRN